MKKGNYGIFNYSSCNLVFIARLKASGLTQKRRPSTKMGASSDFEQLD